MRAERGDFDEEGEEGGAETEGGDGGGDAAPMMPLPQPRGGAGDGGGGGRAGGGGPHGGGGEVKLGHYEMPGVHVQHEMEEKALADDSNTTNLKDLPQYRPTDEMGTIDPGMKKTIADNTEAVDIGFPTLEFYKRFVLRTEGMTLTIALYPVRFYIETNPESKPEL